MAKDLADVVGTALGRVARETVQTVSENARKRSNGTLSGSKGVAAGVGLVALAPLAVKGAGKLVGGLGGNGARPVKKAGEKLTGGVKDAVGEKVGGGVKDAVGGGKIGEAVAGKVGGAVSGKSKGGKSQGVPGVGKGRRMPIQQDIDIGAPLKTVYNQWTQFEDWPKFMHRLQEISQEDDTHVTFKTKIWGISKEFKAEIVDQRPDERIKWKVTEGVTHNGVVTFHELAPRLTRVEVSLDVEPGSLLEKAARGMRHVKRAVRADLARFKAYVLMEDEETGAWRGAIEEGDVKRASSRSRSSSSSRGRKSSSRSRSGSSSSGSRSGSSGRSRTASKSSKSSSSRSRGGSSSSNGRSRSSSKKRRSSSSGTRASSSNGRSSSSRTTARKKSGSRS
ncbi:MAG: SRPBCC family protein [Thermoleophilaceae bacterium]